MQARPSVNYAKDWLDQLIFLFPGLVWKRFLPSMWSLGVSQQPFSCVLGNFPHGDDNQTNEQPGDPSASRLLTSEKAVFCN